MTTRPDLSVVPLPAPTPETRELLCLLLAVAEEIADGSVESFAIVAIRRNGTVTRAVARKSTANAFRLLGAMHHAAHVLSQDIDRTNPITDHLEDA